MNNSPHNLFFIKEEQIQNSEILLTGPEFHHIKNVLRKKPGEIIFFTNGAGKRYKALIEQILQNAMVIKIKEEENIPRHNKINIDLGIAPLKSGRTDFIIEKGTELGVSKFIFFISKFSVINNLTPPRIEHFKKIALSAMLQSQQYYLPDIIFVKDIQKEFLNYDLVVVGDRDGKDKIIPGVQNILLMIGPEGGFAPEEIETFSKNKVKFIPFSTNRLRSETAALAGIVSLTTYYSL
jgi:16S rRNA (uracil1498-N3)-methyltransferase|uniref:Ribosomal RNA small subunit methyltransferase E n=1 Tax=candidate division WOR-3 bacterium TaxID=2052148 RepID=A0A7C6EHC4_UNCW3